MKVPINGSKVHSKPCQVHSFHTKVHSKRMKTHEIAPWAAEVEGLTTASLAVLVARYEERFAEPPRARHRSTKLS